MGDTAESDLQEEILAVLSAPRHGVKFSSKLLQATVSFLVETVMVSSIEEVPLEEPDELEEVASEAWQAALGFDIPRVLALQVRKWAGDTTSSSKSTKETPLAGAKGVGDILGEDRRAAASKEAAEMELTPFEREKAVKDMANQGLTAARIVAFSLSLVLGKVCKMSICVNLRYGEDPALSEPAKQARKASRKLLSSVLKDKEFGELGAFFSDLMRSYAADSMVEESALIAAWWAETSSCFQADNDLLFKYVEEYFEKYAGRGLPVMVDTLLVTRLRNSSAGKGFSKEEGKKIMSRCTDLETQVGKQKSEINTLKQQVESLKEKTGKPKVTPEEQAERRAKVVCHNCGEKGHYSSECQNPKKE